MKFWVVWLVAATLQADSGHSAWLRYAPLEETAKQEYRKVVPAAVASFGSSVLIGSARQEWVKGIAGMLGRTPRVANGLPTEDSILLGTLDTLRQAAPQIAPAAELKA